jgi:exodeoxyribonuclease VII small subunit
LEKPKKKKPNMPAGETPGLLSFEEALDRLEGISRSLESGELGLDDSLAQYEEGIKLARFCQGKLSEAERKIEILQKSGLSVEKKEISVKHDTGEVTDDDIVQGSLL